MENKLLSILIPTFNRASVLEKTIEQLICLSEIYPFTIIICDNASTDSTQEIIAKYTLKYDNIISFCQKRNVGYDRNVAKCYSLVTTKYMWLLGDSSIINAEKFPYIIEQLKTNDYDAIIFNGHDTVKNIPSCIYTDISKLLSDLGWHMTLLSTSILKKDFIENINIQRFYDTYFIHLGVFFEHIVTIENPKINWISENFLDIFQIPGLNLAELKSAGSNWRVHSFEVFGKGWFSIIMSLPNQISVEAKLKCIKNHDKYSHLFSPLNLFRRRKEGILSIKDYKSNKEFYHLITTTPKWILYLILYMPQILISIIYSLYSITKIFKKSIYQE